MDDMKMDHMDGMKMGDMSMDGMMSYFHGGAKETILFEVWKTNGWGTLLLSCIVMVGLGVVYEGLKFFRRWVHARSMSDDKTASREALYGATQEPNHQTELMKHNMKNGMMYPTFSTIHIGQTILFGIQAYLSYALMLVFMTYNVYLCTCVIIGITIGYFVFGHRRPGFDTSLDDCCTT